jgi:membrane protein YqaA with SNARE-associated domain
MIIHQAAAILFVRVMASLWRWIRRLGGLGLIPLGLLDSSVVPVPGSMDALTIILASSQKNWWPYYALMATAGSVLGGYLTYRFARRESEEVVFKRLPRDKMQAVRRTFEKHGFGAILVPAVLPPPAPMVPFLLAAGMAQYSVKKFLVALTLGRLIRFAVFAYLASRFGSQVLGLITHHGKITIVVVTIICVAMGLLFVYRVLKTKPTKATPTEATPAKATRRTA